MTASPPGQTNMLQNAALAASGIEISLCRDISSGSN